MKKKEMVLIAASILLMFGIVRGGRYIVGLYNYRQGIAAIQIAAIELSEIPDGEYVGSCDVDFIRVRVRVLMQDGKIQELELLEHHNDRGDAANVVTGFFMVEGSTMLWDELCAVRGLDERDLKNVVSISAA